MSVNDLTLEKLEIAKRVSAIETKLDVLIAEINADSKNRTDFRNRIETYIDNLRHIVIGNGKPGLVGEIARVSKDVNGLIEREDRKQKHIAGLWLASIGAFIKIAWDNFHGK